MTGVVVNPFVLFPPSGPPAPTDPYWAYVVSLIQGETDIVDAKGNSITQINAHITNSGGKIVFPATSNTDALVVGDTASPGSFDLGTGAFCLEGFVSSTSSGYYVMWDTTGGNGSALGGFLFEVSNPRKCLFVANTGGSAVLQNLSFPVDGSEHHVCALRDGSGNFAMGYDGTIVAVTVNPLTNINSTPNEIVIGNYGANSPYALAGTLRGHRLTKGHMRYTTGLGDTYTVPSMPLPTS